MLYWPKLLITAYAIISTVEPFIPLYLINQLQLTAFQVSFLIATIYLLRLFSFGIWTWIVDNKTHLYGVTIAILILLSSISFILLLAVEPILLNKNNTMMWILLYTCTILNGFFYQPLASLIHSAIIKTLADYRVLFYGSYIRWSKTTTILMTGLIGWLIITTTTKQHHYHQKQQQEDLNMILLVVWIIGMTLLLTISLLFVSVEPANSTQLNISDEQAPLLLKNALQRLSSDHHYQYNNVCYKPYSIFGEQLSHISEEDASQLDRMFTNTDDSLRHVDSFDSGTRTPSFYSEVLPHHSPSSFRQGLEGGGGDYNNYYLSSITIIPTVSANALALLPLSTPTDPLVAFFPWMRSSEQEQDVYTNQYPSSYYYYNTRNNNNSATTTAANNNNKMNNWKLNTLLFTFFLLGVGYALLNTFLFIYIYSVLEISLDIIAYLIMIHLFAEMIVSWTIEKWFIHRFNMILITTSVHIILILCAILYSCLKPNHATVGLIVLQAFQAGIFQLIWFSGSNQVYVIVWNQYDRMKYRAQLAALYSSIGPMVGILIAGFILKSSIEDYDSIFKISVALFSLSFVVSWGWASDV